MSLYKQRTFTREFTFKIITRSKEKKVMIDDKDKNESASNPDIKNFCFDKKSRNLIHPWFKSKMNKANPMYLYSITIGHLWIVDLVKQNGYGDFLFDLFDYAELSLSNLIEWTLSSKQIEAIQGVLTKYNLVYEKKIIKGLDVVKYEEELINLKTKNHPYNILSRYLHMLKIDQFNESGLKVQRGQNIEDFFVNQGSMLNAMYTGFHFGGLVEDEETMDIPEDIQQILFDYSPCMINYEEFRYYPKYAGLIYYITDIMKYFSEHWDWFNNEQEIIIGKLLYSLKIINELNMSHWGINGILSAVSTRILFDNYWQSKYLIINNQIEKYREFTLDRLRLHVLKRTGKKDIEDIDILTIACENGLLEPIPIHGDYFAKSPRDICIGLDLKDEYDKYYEYNSEFIHASFTAVLSGTMLECTNPEHDKHLTIAPTGSRYINSLPHIYEIINMHIELVNNYIGECLIEKLRIEDNTLFCREDFKKHMEELTQN